MGKLKLTHPELSDKNHLDDRLLGDDPCQEVLQGRLNFSPGLKAIRTWRDGCIITTLNIGYFPKGNIKWRGRGVVLS